MWPEKLKELLAKTFNIEKLNLEKYPWLEISVLVELGAVWSLLYDMHCSWIEQKPSFASQCKICKFLWIIDLFLLEERLKVVKHVSLDSALWLVSKDRDVCLSCWWLLSVASVAPAFSREPATFAKTRCYIFHYLELL